MNRKESFHLKILGTRGSVAVEGEEYAHYGGATSCYLIRAGNEEIYLDAGSGIVNAMPSPNTRITILLTHMHFDHLMGLPFFIALREKGRSIDIYAKNRAGLNPKSALDRLISPPFWPVKLEEYPAAVEVHTLSQEKFFIGEIEIDVMEGQHPGGSTVYKLKYQGKSLVYATDFEHTPESCEALAKFAFGCDLLLYDAQYTAEEYSKFRGYGHSTTEAGLRVVKMAKIAKLILVHHEPRRTDKELSDMERDFKEKFEGITFAKSGDEFSLI